MSLSIGIQNANSELQSDKLGIVPGLYWELGLNQSQREWIKMKKARADWALLSVILILGKGCEQSGQRNERTQGGKSGLRKGLCDSGMKLWMYFWIRCIQCPGAIHKPDEWFWRVWRSWRRLPHFLDSSCYKEEQGWSFLISTNLIPPCSMTQVWLSILKDIIHTTINPTHIWPLQATIEASFGM